ncbi:hypothetical protein K1X76_01085 [bacterium]|nr:hypothetical protein [bacterium]
MASINPKDLFDFLEQSDPLLAEDRAALVSLLAEYDQDPYAGIANNELDRGEWDLLSRDPRFLELLEVYLPFGDTLDSFVSSINLLFRPDFEDEIYDEPVRAVSSRLPERVTVAHNQPAISSDAHRIVKSTVDFFNAQSEASVFKGDHDFFKALALFSEGNYDEAAYVLEDLARWMLSKIPAWGSHDYLSPLIDFSPFHSRQISLLPNYLKPYWEKTFDLYEMVQKEQERIHSLRLLAFDEARDQYEFQGAIATALDIEVKSESKSLATRLWAGVEYANAMGLLGYKEYQKRQMFREAIKAYIDSGQASTISEAIALIEQANNPVLNEAHQAWVERNCNRILRGDGCIGLTRDDYFQYEIDCAKSRQDYGLVVAYSNVLLAQDFKNLTSKATPQMLAEVEAHLESAIADNRDSIIANTTLALTRLYPQKTEQEIRQLALDELDRQIQAKKQELLLEKILAQKDLHASLGAHSFFSAKLREGALDGYASALERYHDHLTAKQWGEFLLTAIPAGVVAYLASASAPIIAGTAGLSETSLATGGLRVLLSGLGFVATESLINSASHGAAAFDNFWERCAVMSAIGAVMGFVGGISKLMPATTLTQESLKMAGELGIEALVFERIGELQKWYHGGNGTLDEKNFAERYAEALRMIVTLKATGAITALALKERIVPSDIVDLATMRAMLKDEHVHVLSNSDYRFTAVEMSYGNHIDDLFYVTATDEVYVNGEFGTGKQMVAFLDDLLLGDIPERSTLSDRLDPDATFTPTPYTMDVGSARTEPSFLPHAPDTQEPSMQDDTTVVERSPRGREMPAASSEPPHDDVVTIADGKRGVVLDSLLGLQSTLESYYFTAKKGTGFLPETLKDIFSDIRSVQRQLEQAGIDYIPFQYVWVLTKTGALFDVANFYAIFGTKKVGGNIEATDMLAAQTAHELGHYVDYLNGLLSGISFIGNVLPSSAEGLAGVYYEAKPVHNQLMVLGERGVSFKIEGQDGVVVAIDYYRAYAEAKKMGNTQVMAHLLDHVTRVLETAKTVWVDGKAMSYQEYYAEGHEMLPAMSEPGKGSQNLPSKDTILQTPNWEALTRRYSAYSHSAVELQESQRDRAIPMQNFTMARLGYKTVQENGTTIITFAVKGIMERPMPADTDIYVRVTYFDLEQEVLHLTPSDATGVIRVNGLGQILRAEVLYRKESAGGLRLVTEIPHEEESEELPMAEVSLAENEASMRGMYQRRVDFTDGKARYATVESLFGSPLPFVTEQISLNLEAFSYYVSLLRQLHSHNRQDIWDQIQDAVVIDYVGDIDLPIIMEGAELYVAMLYTNVNRAFVPRDRVSVNVIHSDDMPDSFMPWSAVGFYVPVSGVLKVPGSSHEVQVFSHTQGSISYFDLALNPAFLDGPLSGTVDVELRYNRTRRADLATVISVQLDAADPQVHIPVDVDIGTRVSVVLRHNGGETRERYQMTPQEGLFTQQQLKDMAMDPLDYSVLYRFPLTEHGEGAFENPVNQQIDVAMKADGYRKYRWYRDSEGRICRLDGKILPDGVYTFSALLDLDGNPYVNIANVSHVNANEYLRESILPGELHIVDGRVTHVEMNTGGYLQGVLDHRADWVRNLRLLVDAGLVDNFDNIQIDLYKPL